MPPPGGNGAFSIGWLDADHPALAPLMEPASLYRSVLVSQHFPMAWAGTAEGRALAKLEDVHRCWSSVTSARESC